MARAISLVDASRRNQVYSALRSLAVTDPDERVPFDEEFTRFFEGLFRSGPTSGQEARLSPTASTNPVLQTMDETPTGETRSHSGASATENIANRDFAELDQDELLEARRLVMSMMWQPSDFRTRRWIRATRGPHPDLRRTMRGTVRPEGDLIPIVRRQRRKRQRQLIIIADISGSMEKYADLFLVFAHAAQRRLENVEVFTFSTELTRITDDLRRRDTKTALAKVSASVHDWSGGTKIGEALSDWNRLWSRRLSRGGPIVLVLSDGWDCGDPGLLRMEIARLARSVHSVIWLNPLAARADYRPATRGMQAILPHVDHLLPAASVIDLRDVVRLLDTMRR
jgi:uncharacterized protein with von Willebrand factor type A (vWA) domain